MTALKFFTCKRSQNPGWEPIKIDTRILGFEKSGFDALMNVIHVPEFKHLPKILETPWIKVEDKVQIAPYKKEIEMIRSGRNLIHIGLKSY